MKKFLSAILRACLDAVEGTKDGELVRSKTVKLRQAPDETIFVTHAPNLCELSEQIDAWCTRKGWNEGFGEGDAIDQGSRLAKALLNVHCEISEAQEELRNGHKPTHIYQNDGKPEGFAIELADAMIRVLHLFARLGINPDHAVAYKMSFNEGRPYRHGGKTS